MASSPSSPGEKSLTTLLSTLTTTLHPSTFVFLTFPPSNPIPPALLPDALMTFRESKGTTLIAPLDAVEEHGLSDYHFQCRMITCNVHSSLEAVGFMAVIATRLAELGMGVNPISGFYHDHLFVPAGREDAAMRALGELATEAKAKDKGEDGKAREVRSSARETRSTRWEVAHEMSPHTGYSDLAL